MPHTTTPQTLFPSLTVIQHPLIQDKLAHMRMKSTEKVTFRALLDQISSLMAFEVTRCLPLKSIEIETPLDLCTAHVVSQPCVLVAILRAGLGMMTGFLNVLPDAQEAHIGLSRNAVSKQSQQYLTKIPTFKGQKLFILDPMLATGNSAIKAVEILKEHGIAEENLVFVSLIAAPEGVQNFQGSFPKIPIFTASLDVGLDGNAYIVPGMGDVGDRLFGTEADH